MKEKCKILEHENSTSEKELPELQTKARLIDSLREKVDQHGSPSTLTTQIENFKAYLAKGEEHWKQFFRSCGEGVP